MSNPFDYKDPWRPFEGNGYTLNEYDFLEWYGMDVSEYVAECKRRGVEPDRSEPEEYDPQFEVISTNDAFQHYYVRIIDMTNFLIDKYAYLESPAEVSLWLSQNLPSKPNYEVRIYVNDMSFE